MSAALAAIRERSGGRCMCDGVCGRQHTGRCENVEGQLGNYSRHPVRLTIVRGRELCVGCQEPFRKSLTRIRRRRIPAMESTR